MPTAFQGEVLPKSDTDSIATQPLAMVIFTSVRPLQPAARKGDADGLECVPSGIPIPRTDFPCRQGDGYLAVTTI
jgi:hypothetical protein